MICEGKLLHHVQWHLIREGKLLHRSCNPAGTVTNYMHPALASRLKSARAMAVTASMTTGARRAMHAS